MKKGFSLIQIIITVAIIAIMTSLLTPSLLSHVERSRASKDVLAMDEVTHSIEIGVAEQKIFEEIIAYSIPDNISCYIDSVSESNHIKHSTKLSNGQITGYTFDSAARSTDGVQYYGAGNMKGLTITFEPTHKNGKTYYDLNKGVVNKFVKNDGDVLENLPNLNSQVEMVIGKLIECSSQTYKNSEFTVFICLPSTGGNDGNAKSGIKVYGQYSGTNLSGTIQYEVAQNRITSDTVLDNDSTGSASGNTETDRNESADKESNVIGGGLGDKNQNGGSTNITFDDEGRRIYDEVIVMIDGSTSIDSEWPAMVEAIMQIGEEFLGDNDVETEMTLMAFGMSPTVVAAHIETIEKLETILSQYSGNLLYGRSATNCAGGFDGIVNYINSQDDLLKNACVIYVTDGGVNMNNKTVVWKESAKNMSQAYANEAMLSELSAISNGQKASDALLSVFGDEFDQLMNYWTIYKAGGADASVALNAINEIQNQISSSGITKSKQWVMNVFSDVFSFANLDENEEYPIYTIEKAILDYEVQTNTYIENAFYYAAIKTSAIMGNKTINKQCAIDAGIYAASVAEQIYLVQYGNDTRADWMQQVIHENVQYVSAGNIGNLAKTVKDFLASRS